VPALLQGAQGLVLITLTRRARFGGRSCKPGGEKSA
jgi:hypothetical protein